MVALTHNPKEDSVTTKLMSLVMPEGSQELVEAHAAAERGDAYASLRREIREVDFSLYPIVTVGFGLLAWCTASLSWDCMIDDPMSWNDVVAPWLGRMLMVVAGTLGVLACLGGYGYVKGRVEYHKLSVGAPYRHRRLPEEEEVLKDKLTVVAVELSRQVELYESLRAEVEFQGRMAEAGLPADLDIERCRQIAHALHDDLAPKLAQLSVLIQRRNRKAEAKEVDLVALRDTLGGQHRDLIANLKAQQEMDGDPAVQLLHNAVRADAVNAELGDTAAAARELAARRRQKA